MFHCLRRRSDFPDIGPSLFVIWNDELVNAFRNDVALQRPRVGKEHERFFPTDRGCGLYHRLRRAVVVVHFDKISLRHAELLHVIWMDLDKRIGPPVHDELVLLIEVRRLPSVIGAAIVDQVGKLILFRLLALGLETTPLQ